ncbi:glycosyltransferase [Rhodanobacter sp. 7MK24]|uniref:glycosyltransferase n=1 Tax=Rhodanobacter sp. 7MK24 TaxID=2775922 RepID=UPI00177BAF78|nr:glycosyltransferase [Rhodanobacter sp. 7MK24]MBD8881754.1 glycosyltransferase [Rhodanobacter sp. 7MK24]
MHRTVNLIVRDNGLGLSRDARLLAEALTAHGCQVEYTRLGEADERERWRHGHGWRARLAQWRHAWSRLRGRPRYDVNIMFEHLWPLHLPLARCNIALPNPEWFDARDQLHLRRIDHVWAKTRHAEQRFRELGCAVRWVGFASEDAAVPGHVQQRTFFHLAGGSRTKGSEELVALWLQHPEWPVLTLVRHGGLSEPATRPTNLQVVDEYLDLDRLRALQNTHAFHLCPSKTEGYGHYLCEAMSAGAITVTTDAEPMNELVQPDRGLLVAATAEGQQGLAMLYRFEPAAMERAVETCLRMDDAQRAVMGRCARAWFVDNQAHFFARIGAALDVLSA